MEDRAAQLRVQIALYRSYLEDGSFPQQTEFYVLRLFEAEDELEQFELNKSKLH